MAFLQVNARNGTLLLLVVAGVSWAGWASTQDKQKSDTQATTEKFAKDDKKGGTGKGKPISVAVAEVKTADIHVVENGLGTVVANNSVTVRSRVAGQLVHVYFQEGQLVKAGQLLAEIDPRPLQAQLTQVQGQAARNSALLQTAKLDLARYRDLLARDALSAQQVEAQASLVQQYHGSVLADQGLVDNAKLQLSFTKISAPSSGRIGLRQIDAGNLIATETPLAVIHQVQPVSVVFTVHEDKVSQLLQQSKRAPLAVEAWDKHQQQLLATGKLASLDNQIDSATGTIKIKAQFANDNGQLFPNQFVNARLLLQTLSNATVIPVAAIQQGNKGAFVYTLQPDQTVSVREVKTGVEENGLIVVNDGLALGEKVVVSGVDKLREGAKVAVRDGRKGQEGGDKGQQKADGDKSHERLSADHHSEWKKSATATAPTVNQARL